MNLAEKGTNETKSAITIKKKTSLVRIAIWLFLWIGSLTILASILYASSILAFIGLGLVFWGILLLYIQPEEYAKKILLDATLIPTLSSLNKLINELDYKGKAVYPLLSQGIMKQEMQY